MDKPCPRLEFNWVKPGETWASRECIYSLVLPLGEHDIRHDNDNAVNGELFIEIGRTQVNGNSRLPIWEDGTVDTPFRDGAHAQWDSIALSGIPIVACCCDT